MSHSRYNFPMPYGWFQVAYSMDVESGQSKCLRYFGQDLVVFRGEDGVAQVIDAYCPHQGAHLGKCLHNQNGANIEGNNIVCPFHGWKFDRRGHVAEIPYAKNIPPRAKDKQVLKTWPTVERNQLIWVWYHPDEAVSPMWEVESLPELDNTSSSWSPLSREKSRCWQIPTIPQEIAENAIDYAHFIYVHQVKSTPIPDAQVFEQHRSSRTVNADMETPKGIVKGGISSQSHGPGQGWTRFSGITDTLLLGNVTPVDENTTEVNFSFSQPMVNGEVPTGGVHEAIIADICKQLDEDTIIWESKIYREDPLLCDGDGPVAKFRRHYAQFYAN